MPEIRVAFVGIGNCASAVIQSRFYYQKIKEEKHIPGLMHPVMGGYRVTDIIPVVAFDVDARKVNRDLSEAIFASPNCTEKVANVPRLGVKVLMGPVMDGVTKHLERYVKVSDKKSVKNVSEILRREKVDVLVNNLPTGSKKASRFYAEEAIKAGVGYVNGMPELIVNDKEFAKRAEKQKAPLVGDDYKSQVGGTILNRALLNLFLHRGIKVKECYQINYGGNTDFWNFVEWNRYYSKHLSKGRGIKSVMPYEIDFSLGVTHVELLKDHKICRIEIEGENFTGTKITLEAKLRVIDSSNSGGVMVDAIRCCKLAKDRDIGGVLIGVSAYLMKSPPKQFTSDEEARKAMDEFIEGKRER